MLAANLDTLLFLLLMAGVGLLRLLVKKAGGETIDDEPAPPPRTPPPLPGASSQRDEERIRKFLEALGQPTTNLPPPPVSPRPVPPAMTEYQRTKMEEAARARRRRSITPRLPPLTTVPPPLPRRVQMPGQITMPPEEQKIFKPVERPPEAYQVLETTAAPPPPPPRPITTAAEAYAAVTQTKGAPSATSKIPLMDLLRSADGLRQAILLREILGPPRSLQPLEDS